MPFLTTRKSHARCLFALNVERIKIIRADIDPAFLLSLAFRPRKGRPDDYLRVNQSCAMKITRALRRKVEMHKEDKKISYGKLRRQK